jgi:ATP-dependent protease Clp ATPase subunit
MAAMRGGAPTVETLNTRHILFIVSGAFPGLGDFVRRRLAAEGPARAAGGRSAARRAAPADPWRPVRSGHDEVDRLLPQLTTPDLIAFGLEPEFVGRLPVRVACHGLGAGDLFDVLRKSESSLIHQYERAFSAYGIQVEFRDDGLRRLASMAATEATGARGLMTVCERVFRDFKFRLPSSRVRRFAVTARLVEDPRGELRRLLRRPAKVQV